MPIEIFRGRVLSTEERAAIRREIESLDTIEQIDDEMRALIIRNWPDLAAKPLPSVLCPAASKAKSNRF